GGLDTSFCIPWLAEEYGRPVITITVNTGGIDAAAAADLQQRATALGAIEHHIVDAQQTFFDDVLRYLIAGNVKRGQLYPLCVGAERGVQAQVMARVANDQGATHIAHGCTAAGNDQVRFEVALAALAPDAEVLAPVRDNAWQREGQIQFLKDRNLPLPPAGGDYSINRGLWGVTIGGRETLTSADTIPESAWVLSPGKLTTPEAPEQHAISFTAGIPTHLDGEAMAPVALIEAVEALAARFAIGRGIHVGDTILGTKGRVAFEAPAAELLIETHRELEKLTLSGQQLKVKEPLSLTYGDLVHEGKHLDPACRDIEALLASSQAHVTGTVRFQLSAGSLFVTGVDSDASLLAATKGVYGEAAGEWTPRDALGYARVLSLPGILQRRAGADS
ncbi:MAG: argininosuccinate synthase domain-containing protein, partial [Pseudomonadota bacterium]